MGRSRFPDGLCVFGTYCDVEPIEADDGIAQATGSAAAALQRDVDLAGEEPVTQRAVEQSFRLQVCSRRHPIADRLEDIDGGHRRGIADAEPFGMRLADGAQLRHHPSGRGEEDLGGLVQVQAGR